MPVGRGVLWKWACRWYENHEESVEGVVCSLAVYQSDSYLERGTSSGKKTASTRLTCGHVGGIFSSLINVDGPISLWASVSPGQVVLGCITNQADEQVRKHLFLRLSWFLPQVPLMMAMLCRHQPDKPFLSQTALVTVFITAEGSLRKRGGHQTLFFCPVWPSD